MRALSTLLLLVASLLAIVLVLTSDVAASAPIPDPDRPPCSWKSGHARIKFGTTYRMCQLVGGTWVDVTARLWNGKPSYLVETYGDEEKAICEMTPWSKYLTTRRLKCGYIGRPDEWQNKWSWSLSWHVLEGDERVGNFGGLAPDETWQMTGCVDPRFQSSPGDCPYQVNVTARMVDGLPSYDPATLDTHHEKTYCTVTPWGQRSRHLICSWKETGRIWKWSGKYGNH